MEALRAGTVFDGHDVRRGVDVVVDGDELTGLRPVAESPQEARVTDFGPDATILPGLVDAHQHVTWDCSPDPLGWHQRSSDEELLERARLNARTALVAGITTIRDLGDRGWVALALRAECSSDPAAGPRILSSGPPLTSPGGHCWFLGGEVASPAEIRAAVRERADRGADVVKVMTTGGNVTPGSLPHESQFADDDLDLLVAEAHGLGLPVAAHAHGVDGVASAVRAGADTIEHCSFFTEDGVAERPDVVALLADTGVFVSLTLGMTPGGPPPPPAILSRLPLMQAHVHRMAEAGVRLGLGTDAGIAPIKPHDVLRHAVADLAAVLTPLDALRTATAGAADALGLGSGRLARGAAADVLVVDGDATADVGALHRVRAVYRSGVLVHGDAPRT